VGAWPEPEQLAVFDPPAPLVDAPSVDEVRRRIAMSRVRTGLPTGDELVAEVLDRAHESGSAHPGILTASEEQETWGDNETGVEIAYYAVDGERAE
jgi:hypothetical protein